MTVLLPLGGEIRFLVGGPDGAAVDGPGDRAGLDGLDGLDGLGDDDLDVLRGVDDLDNGERFSCFGFSSVFFDREVLSGVPRTTTFLGGSGSSVVVSSSRVMVSGDLAFFL